MTVFLSARTQTENVGDDICVIFFCIVQFFFGFVIYYLRSG